MEYLSENTKQALVGNTDFKLTHEVKARAENLRVTRKGEWTECERITKSCCREERSKDQTFSMFASLREDSVQMKKSRM